MNSEKYVLLHDYGYGLEPELKDLVKLKLRNIDDLKVYINDILNRECVEDMVFNYQIIIEETD